MYGKYFRCNIDTLSGYEILTVQILNVPIDETRTNELDKQRTRISGFLSQRKDDLNYLEKLCAWIFFLC